MLFYGGIYGNPKNKNSKNGNLRLLYECAPMSYIVEQAGGKASDGHQRILDIHLPIRKRYTSALHFSLEAQKKWTSWRSIWLDKSQD
uniref:Fructose-1-6-bisphosphatase class 1 C-terminal domain-containing protein n=1 Tax=Nelumbo nucifera TaxID=4432 RepID=A0A822YAK2_NELNU|nr:TPA_asm: hypothetical protein HUJ06_028066 [Nelumbo nucifera]